MFRSRIYVFCKRFPLRHNLYYKPFQYSKSACIQPVHTVQHSQSPLPGSCDEGGEAPRGVPIWEGGALLEEFAGRHVLWKVRACAVCKPLNFGHFQLSVKVKIRYVPENYIILTLISM